MNTIRASREHRMGKYRTDYMSDYMLHYMRDNMNTT